MTYQCFTCIIRLHFSNYVNDESSFARLETKYISVHAHFYDRTIFEHYGRLLEFSRWRSFSHQILGYPFLMMYKTLYLTVFGGFECIYKR